MKLRQDPVKICKDVVKKGLRSFEKYQLNFFSSISPLSEAMKGTRHETRHKMRLVCVVFTFKKKRGTDGPTDGLTDEWTDTTSYRVATAHLRRQRVRREKSYGFDYFPGETPPHYSDYVYDARQISWLVELSVGHVSVGWQSSGDGGIDSGGGGDGGGGRGGGTSSGET